MVQLGNPAKAERLMHFGGSLVHFRGVAFQVRGLRSAYPKLWNTARVSLEKRKKKLDECYALLMVRGMEKSKHNMDSHFFNFLRSTATEQHRDKRLE